MIKKYYLFVLSLSFSCIYAASAEYLTIPERVAQDYAAELASLRVYPYKRVRSFVNGKYLETRIPNPAFETDFEAEKKTLYDNIIKEYEIYEESLQQDPTLSQHEPLAQISGGITYGMSVDEMKDIAQQKFKALKDSGKIITPAAFEEIKESYFIPLQDLTRIWGAEYLKQEFAERGISNFDVPDFVIVTDNPRQISLNLKLKTNDWYPQLDRLTEGDIYFQKITGTPVANRVGRTIAGTGYSDFAIKSVFSDSAGDEQKNRNILQDAKTQKYFVVDTEFKSFDFRGHKQNIQFLDYLKRRFKLLNQEIYDEVNLPITINI